MKSHSSIWELYIKEGFLELPPGKDSKPDFKARINDEMQKTDDLFELDTARFNNSLNIAKIVTSSNVPWTNENYTSYTDTLWMEYVPLKKAEMTITHLENRHIVDKYFYGHAIRVLKALDSLDGSLPGIIQKEYELFQLHKKKIDKENVAVIVKTELEILNNNTKNLLSLLGLASDRHIEKQQLDISGIKRVAKNYNDVISEISEVEPDINTLIKAYRSLELVAKDRKTLKALRRPISKRFGLFKGHILKTCSKLDYFAGLEQCERLSNELKYVQENLDEVQYKKRIFESIWNDNTKFSEVVESYKIPLSTVQLDNILDLIINRNNLDTELIYFENKVSDIKNLSDSNISKSNSLLNNQKTYLLGVYDALSKTLVKAVPDFKNIDSVVDSIDSTTQELNEYLPQLEKLNMNKVSTNTLIKNSDEFRKKLVESKGVYDLLEKNLRYIEQLEMDTNKNGLSETRLNTLGSIVQDSKTIPVIPISTLKKQYESEHREYKKKVELFIDIVITKIDELASKTPASADGSADILRYYEKVQTFRDISQKVKDYRNLVIESKKNSHSAKVIYEPIIPIPRVIKVNTKSIVEQLKTLKFPNDNRYLVIDNIIRIQKYSNGWIDRMNQLSIELDNLKGQKNLLQTDYVLKIADIIKESYKNGYLKTISDDSDNKKIIVSTIDKLYTFGRVVAPNVA